MYIYYYFIIFSILESYQFKYKISIKDFKNLHFHKSTLKKKKITITIKFYDNIKTNANLFLLISFKIIT